MTLLLVIPVPLSNAGSTGVGEYNATNIIQNLGLDGRWHEFE